MAPDALPQAHSSSPFRASLYQEQLNGIRSAAVSGEVSIKSNGESFGQALVAGRRIWATANMFNSFPPGAPLRLGQPLCHGSGRSDQEPQSSPYAILSEGPGQWRHNRHERDDESLPQLTTSTRSEYGNTILYRTPMIALATEADSATWPDTVDSKGRPLSLTRL